MSDETTIERPLRADAERNRKRILAAARTVFAERGIEASLDDVAREAGVGIGTVYRRFPDKHALIDAIFEDKLDRVTALIEDALADDDPWEGFVHFFTEVSAMHAEDRGFKDVVLSVEEAQERVNVARDRIEPLARKLVERAQASGQLRADIAPLDVPMMHSMLGTLAEATAPAEPDYWRRHLRVMLDGLMVRRDEPSPMPAPPMERERFTEAMSRSHLARRRPR